METKELKVQAPEGYEIDKENSTFECIKFKSIKKNVTYKDVGNKLFGHSYYFINERGGIISYTGKNKFDGSNALNKFDENNAPTSHQLKRILALNQLLNIAEYYNRLHTIATNPYTIMYDKVNKIYYANATSSIYLCGIKAIFNRKEDAQAVINNPNFREILDTIYK